MGELHSALLTLQELDLEIEQTQAKLQEFEPRLAALEQPVSDLERAIAETDERLQGMRKDAARLEKGAEQKRERLRTYEERLLRVRSVREESAARTEIDLVRRATEADEVEAIEMMEQATRTDLKLDDLQRQLDQARAGIDPQKQALLQEREELADAIKVLRDRRENHAVRIDRAALRLYERVRSGRSRVALAPLTPEGACGACFNVLPIQEQSEVRSGVALKRCEACGVILYAPD